MALNAGIWRVYGAIIPQSMLAKAQLPKSTVWATLTGLLGSDPFILALLPLAALGILWVVLPMGGHWLIYQVLDLGLDSHAGRLLMLLPTFVPMQAGMERLEGLFDLPLWQVLAIWSGTQAALTRAFSQRTPASVCPPSVVLNRSSSATAAGWS